ncbi:hypothetical protein [Acholeplasma hippikon]|uniref:Uncharacterized protein n=1 Tax=Acholeplasma hippikon TaxID=264636 RepID=A0A449BJT9_9MOLU|nr:hypothetical protein [Acholeplasma hippikon]VEU82735.1 Uncharacterised protein [Acholeplasma hippikon]
MYCRICNQYINRKVTLKNFFYKDYRDTCINCFKAKMNLFPYFVIPIQSGMLHIFELLAEDVKDYSLFIDYFYPYYKAYLKTNRLIDAIYMDYLDQQYINLLDKFEVGNLIIFTNKYKED